MKNFKLVWSARSECGVKINSEKISDVKLEIDKGSDAIYQVGKRKFLKIIIK